MRTQTGSSQVFLVALAAAVAFIWLTSRGLPPVVASHFGASGAADGFMPRGGYAWFMTALAAVVPSLLVFLPERALRHPKARINLPHRDYWLAPERREATIDHLCANARRMGYWLIAFLVYVHWLVVEANRTTPPTLDSTWFIAGLVGFALGMLMSIVGIFRRFGRLPTRDR